MEIDLDDLTDEVIEAALSSADDNQIEAEFESRGLGESYYETAFDAAYDSVDKAVAMIRGGDVDGGLLFIERMARPKFGSLGAILHAYKQEMEGK